MFTYAVAAVLATVLILTPLVVLRVWNEGARMMRRRSARKVAAGIGAALCLAGCGPDPATGVESSVGGMGGSVPVDAGDAGCPLDPNGVPSCAVPCCPESTHCMVYRCAPDGASCTGYVPSNPECHVDAG